MNHTKSISLALAESTVRGIARREGEIIKKRRGQSLIEHLGAGYMVGDPQSGFVLLGGFGAGRDGCNADLADLAMRYEDCERNTLRQKIVLNAVKGGRVEGGV